MITIAGTRINLITIIANSLFIAMILIFAAWILLPDWILSGQPVPGPESAASAGTPGTATPLTPGDAIQAISLVSERAISASSAAVNTMNNFITVLVSIALAAIGASALRLKQSSDEIRNVQEKYEDILNKFEKLQDILSKSQDDISTLSTRYLNLQQELLTLPQQILPYEVAVKALNKNEITLEDFEASQVWYSWLKWVFTGNDTGYEELLYHKKNADGLPVSIRLSAITELDRVEKKCRKPGAATARDFDYRVKLLKLLNIEQEPMGSA